MSIDEAMTEDLCDAYRKGCQGRIDAKFDAANARIDTVAARIEVVSAKLEALKINEIQHLQQELDQVRKTRRDPLGWKEKSAIIGFGVTAVTAIIVEIIRYFRP